MTQLRDRTLVLLSLAAFAAVSFQLRPSEAAASIAVLAVALAGVSLVESSLAARRLVVLVALLVAPAAFPRAAPWPLSLVAPFALYLALERRWPALGHPPRAWLRRGDLALGWIAAVIAMSTAGLVGWVLLARPDLRDLARFVPDVPIPLLVLGGVAFSLGNAALEEAMFRGAMQHELRETFSPRAAIALQGVAFGALHFHGFPRGAVGVGLAAFYGVVLGALRERTRGLLSPLIAHVAADMTIATLLYFFARG